MTSRKALIPAVVAVALVVAGCGGTEPEDAVRDYYGALARGDGKAACAELSAALRERVERSPAALSSGSRCEDLLALAPALNPQAREGAAEDLDVEVDASGDEATASVENPLVQRPETLELVSEEGDWRISAYEFGPRP